MKFTRIGLENWRNFTHVDVTLQQRMFLVGPNASGKSNLLDVFRFLRDLVRVGGGLEKAVADRGGVSHLRSLAAPRDSAIIIEVELSDPDDTVWRCRIGITEDRASRVLLQEEKVWRKGELLLERPNDRDREDTVLLRQTYLEQSSMNRDFRSIADFFETIDYYHMVPQIVRDPILSSYEHLDAYGSGFLKQLASLPKKVQEARLRCIRDVLQTVIPQIQGIQLIKNGRGIPHLGIKYSHWQDAGHWETEADFSDGTLRLIGLLWALMSGNGPLLLEEPELSLHPGIIEYIPAMLISIPRSQKKRARQTFASTHSSDLLRDPGIAPSEILILRPMGNETNVEAGRDIQELLTLVDAGLPLSETVFPFTRPRDTHQLLSFGL